MSEPKEESSTKAMENTGLPLSAINQNIRSKYGTSGATHGTADNVASSHVRITNNKLYSKAIRMATPPPFPLPQPPVLSPPRASPTVPDKPQRQTPDFYKPKRVVSVSWITDDYTRNQGEYSGRPLERRVKYEGTWYYTKLRRFVVVKAYKYHWVGFPIFTHGGRGLGGSDPSGGPREKHEYTKICDVTDRDQRSSESRYPNVVYTRAPWFQTDNDVGKKHKMHPKSYVHFANPVSFRFEVWAMEEGSIRIKDVDLILYMFNGATPLEASQKSRQESLKAVEAKPTSGLSPRKSPRKPSDYEAAISELIDGTELLEPWIARLEAPTTAPELEQQIKMYEDATISCWNQRKQWEWDPTVPHPIPNVQSLIRFMEYDAEKYTQARKRLIETYAKTYGSKYYATRDLRRLGEEKYEAEQNARPHLQNQARRMSDPFVTSPTPRADGFGWSGETRSRGTYRPPRGKGWGRYLREGSGGMLESDHRPRGDSRPRVIENWRNSSNKDNAPSDLQKAPRPD